MLEQRELLAVLSDSTLAGDVTATSAKVFVRTDLSRESATEVATLPYVLRHGTRAIPSLRGLSRALEGLYGASIGVDRLLAALFHRERTGVGQFIASFFADAGIATYALDFPGHGRSNGKRGHIRDFQEYTDALGALLSLAREAHPDIPFVLFGHSMGGLIAADFLLQHQSAFVAAVLTGAAIQSPQQPSSIVLFINGQHLIKSISGIRNL